MYKNGSKLIKKLILLLNFSSEIKSIYTQLIKIRYQKMMPQLWQRNMEWTTFKLVQLVIHQWLQYLIVYLLKWFNQFQILQHHNLL